MRFFLFLGLLVLNSFAFADSWRYPPVAENRVEKFGNSRIVLTTDARQNQKHPDFILSVYDKDELKAKYRGVSFQKLFASPDNSRFLGISNRGLPGTAAILFDKEGNLLFEVKHGMAAFDYCDESVTLVRKWFDEENPDVKFVMDEKFGGYKGITLRDCRGNTRDLIPLVLQAYGKSWQQFKEISGR